MENNGDEVAILFPEGHLALRFSVFTSVQSRFSSYFFFFFFFVVFTSESGNLLTYMKNIYFSSS